MFVVSKIPSVLQYRHVGHTVSCHVGFFDDVECFVTAMSCLNPRQNFFMEKTKMPLKCSVVPFHLPPYPIHPQSLFSSSVPPPPRSRPPLTAATMTGLAAAVSATGEPVLALKLSSTLLYASVTGILTMMNKIQPSQLAEEQRNASRLFKQLHFELQNKVSLVDVDMDDVNEAMEKVLALDKAYPLPLFGSMIEKFPSLVEPAVWWPKEKLGRKQGRAKSEGNGWNLKMEQEMREIADVLKRKDVEEYLKLGEKALNLNKLLAKSGPVLTALGAIGSAFIGLDFSSSVEELLKESRSGGRDLGGGGTEEEKRDWGWIG